jgi:putative ABC transport system ATP-binding protein
MDSNLFKYILKHSWREQLFILALVLVSQVPYFLSLDLPKTIVNSPIQAKDSIPPMRRLGICASNSNCPTSWRRPTRTS